MTDCCQLRFFILVVRRNDSMKLFSLKSIVTNNFTDPEMARKIQQVWGDSMKQIDQPMNVYGVYHEFKSDFRGDYQLSIATESIPTKEILEVDSQANYQKFEVDLSQEMAVYKTWQRIWSLEDEGKLTRAYRLDYEYYQEDGKVTIYVETI